LHSLTQWPLISFFYSFSSGFDTSNPIDGGAKRFFWRQPQWMQTVEKFFTSYIFRISQIKQAHKVIVVNKVYLKISVLCLLKQKSMLYVCKNKNKTNDNLKNVYKFILKYQLNFNSSNAKSQCLKWDIFYLLIKLNRG
jgi:hypothetical protein